MPAPRSRRCCRWRSCPRCPTAADETPAQVRLTDAGRRHPVTELATSNAQNETAWSSLPRLPGLNTAGPLKGGAQTLLQSGEGRPVLVVGEAGRGRVLALLSDSSWFWSFVAAGAQQGPRAYETFWHSAIRWLVRDPALTPMRVASERPAFEPGGDAPALTSRFAAATTAAAAGAQIAVVTLLGHGPRAAAHRRRDCRAGRKRAHRAASLAARRLQGGRPPRSARTAPSSARRRTRSWWPRLPGS